MLCINIYVTIMQQDASWLFVARIGKYSLYAMLVLSIFVHFSPFYLLFVLRCLFGLFTYFSIRGSERGNRYTDKSHHTAILWRWRADSLIIFYVLWSGSLIGCHNSTGSGDAMHVWQHIRWWRDGSEAGAAVHSSSVPFV